MTEIFVIMHPQEKKDFKDLDETIEYIMNDLIGDHLEKDLIEKGIKLYAEKYHKMRFNRASGFYRIGEWI